MSDDLVQRLRLFRPSGGSLFEAAQEQRELMDEAADRIETVTRERGAEVQRSYKQLKRIETLEAALREISRFRGVNPNLDNDGNVYSSFEALELVIEIARRALEGKP